MQIISLLPQRMPERMAGIMLARRGIIQDVFRFVYPGSRIGTHSMPLKGDPESGISDVALKGCQGFLAYTQTTVRKTWWSRA